MPHRTSRRGERARASDRRVILAPDRIVSNRKRSKLSIIAAAGVLGVATAASAAVWSTGPSGATSVGNVGGMVRTRAPRRSEPGRARLVSEDLALSPSHPVLEVLAVHAGQRADVAPATGARQAAAHVAPQTARQAAPNQATTRGFSTLRQGQAVAAQQSAATAVPASPSESPSPSPTTSTPAASGTPQSIAEAMLGSYGWSASQFSCLDPLWAHESGWSVTATNPSTGAYGIPQAMPGVKMASAGPDWQTDATTQVRWGLTYIQDTYGSPCAAWSHEETDGWY